MQIAKRKLAPNNRDLYPTAKYTVTTTGDSGRGVGSFLGTQTPTSWDQGWETEGEILLVLHIKRKGLRCCVVKSWSIYSEAGISLIWELRKILPNQGALRRSTLPQTGRAGRDKSKT